MESVRADLCIIGAGSGGLSLAAGAAQLGADVVLLEGGRMGGDCLNTGCVPSKAFLAAARVYGSDPDGYLRAMAHVQEAIATIAPHDSQERFEALGVRVLREYGQFISATEVRAGKVQITARRFVIATGSSPLVPLVPGLDSVPFLTSETLFDLKARPDHLVIVGGGPVGVEMAQAHVRLGCKVSVIEAETVLGAEDPEASALVMAALRGEGVTILEGAKPLAVSGHAGSVSIETSGGTVSGTHLLLAAGRVPNTRRLDLAAAGVECSPQGITVDRGLRTSNRRVYAIGDVVGQARLTHVAGYHAGVAARAILFGLPATARTDHLPRVIYTEPELAQIGLTEEEARARHGGKVEVVTAGFDQNDRAVTDAAGPGFVKILVLRGRPIGVTIVGAHAGENIAPWAVILANRLKMRAVASTVFPYPTLSEAGKRAAGAYFSTRLFDSAWIRRFVGSVQRHIP